MQWIKIKTKHILNNGFTLLEIGALVKMQVLTAHLERIPTESELRSEVTDKVRRSVEERLHSQCTTLAHVLHKVCEDVAHATHLTRMDSARKRKQRNDKEKDVLSDGTCVTQNRVDENRVEENVNPFFIPKDHVLANCKTFHSLIIYLQNKECLTDNDKKDIRILLQSACKQPHTIYELQELTETMINKLKKVKKVTLTGSGYKEVYE